MGTWLLLAALSVATTQDPAVFRADTHLVQINVIVRDKNGPVDNLNQSDFTITDHGKPRTISIFSVHKTAATAPAASVQASPPLPANTFSNHALRGADAPPSVTVILLDRLNTLRGGIAADAETPLFSSDQALLSAKQHLLKYLDELDPQQRVAIYSLGQGITVLSDFTGDRARLKSIVENYRAISITSQEVAEPTTIHLANEKMAEQANRDSQLLAGMSNAQRAQTTMAALMAVAAHVAGIPGRKNLVWLTSDLNIPAAALGRVLGRSDIAVYPVDARGLLPFDLGHSGIDADAELALRQYRGTPSGTGAGQTVPPGIAAMQELAEETGGRAYVNGNDLTGAIRAAINDGEVSYTLGFYVDTKSLDDKFHELKVRVKRASLDVRTQRGYFALKDAGDAQNNALAASMTSPLETSAIRVSARLDRAGPDFTLTGSIDVRDLQLDQSTDSSKGAVTIYVIQQDAAGTSLERRSEALQLQLTREEYAASLQSGVVFRTVLQPKEGLKTLRVVVMDRAHSTTGSLIIPISEIK